MAGIPRPPGPPGRTLCSPRRCALRGCAQVCWQRGWTPGVTLHGQAMDPPGAGPPGKNPAAARWTRPSPPLPQKQPRPVPGTLSGKGLRCNDVNDREMQSSLGLPDRPSTQQRRPGRREEGGRTEAPEGGRGQRCSHRVGTQEPHTRARERRTHPPAEVSEGPLPSCTSIRGLQPPEPGGWVSADLCSPSPTRPCGLADAPTHLPRTPTPPQGR